MRRRQKHSRPETTNHDGDVVSTVYGDFITFMMMLFVLLFIMSYNQNKNQDFMTEFQVKFGDKQEELKQQASTDSLLVSNIQHYIQDNKLEDQATVVVDEHRIKLILAAPLLFDSGTAALKPSAIPLIEGAAKIFKDVLNPIVIEGHTDNIPIHTSQYDSNWDLSFDRGYTIVKYFIQKQGYSPARLSVLGYGEYKPLVPNDSAENRNKNRRVEITVIRVTKKDELPSNKTK